MELLWIVFRKFNERLTQMQKYLNSVICPRKFNDTSSKAGISFKSLRGYVLKHLREYIMPMKKLF